MLGITKRNFSYISGKCFIILYKSLVRSHLEYANSSVWYPKRKVDVEKLERVQKRAIKLIPEISKKSCRERFLQVLNLLTLKYRRYRGDMVEVFKIIKGIYDPTCVPHLDLLKLSNDEIRTRGTKYKLIQRHCCYDLPQPKLVLDGRPTRVLSLRSIGLTASWTVCRHSTRSGPYLLHQF